MNPTELLAFMRSHSLAVQASVSPSGAPQAAVVAFAVTDDFEILFDALESTRKIPNLRKNPKIALVIGGLTEGNERTVQYEGVADEPHGAPLERLKEIYFARFPDGRDRLTWPGLVYVRVRPRWIRYSDFNRRPPEIVEFKGEQLRTRAER
ncbi:MAG TPA: pyridoxamine 5'-phosphate oxidase family protein [Planctomycetota bacterium]|nr:pyridoxamine 5'-phosphate oxidase family protein [Planctomycetota bacterium]